MSVFNGATVQHSTLLALILPLYPTTIFVVERCEILSIVETQCQCKTRMWLLTTPAFNYFSKLYLFHPQLQLTSKTAIGKNVPISWWKWINMSLDARYSIDMNIVRTFLRTSVSSHQRALELRCSTSRMNIYIQNILVPWNSASEIRTETTNPPKDTQASVCLYMCFTTVVTATPLQSRET